MSQQEMASALLVEIAERGRTKAAADQKAFEEFMAELDRAAELVLVAMGALPVPAGDQLTQEVDPR